MYNVAAETLSQLDSQARSGMSQEATELFISIAFVFFFLSGLVSLIAF